MRQQTAGGRRGSARIVGAEGALMRKASFLALAAALFLVARDARAHVSAVTTTAFANQTQIVTFGVGHGCAGVDTFSLRVEVPAGVTSVRAVRSTLGPARIETDATGAVTAVTWEKALADVAEGDPNYYEVSIRAKIPDAPFTALAFRARQICSTPAGVKSPPVDWYATADAPDAGSGEPAPRVLVLPARSPGWNKFTAPVDVTDLKAFFADAQIVWRGTAAFSANPNTAALIATTAGATALTSVAAGDVLWVKY
jgi:uncharacterized protein YcnI